MRKHILLLSLSLLFFTLNRSFAETEKYGIGVLRSFNEIASEGQVETKTYEFIEDYPSRKSDGEDHNYVFKRKSDDLSR